MRPLTDHTPKPLLRAGGRSLIEWQIVRLVAAGIRQIVVNVAHLGEQIVEVLGSGEALGASICYSREPVALETAGGIALALPLLGAGAFIAVNADVFCEYDLRGLVAIADRMNEERSSCARAHLLLVPNPEHHSRGDFSLGVSGRIAPEGGRRMTYSGLGVYEPAFFASVVAGERRALGPMLHAAVARGEVTGEAFEGLWMDIGTPARLDELRKLLMR